MAVFTISCTNENESIDTNNNELVGRTFFAFPDEIVRFIGNDVKVYSMPTFPNAKGYGYPALGHWVGDTVHFSSKNWNYDPWYIDSNYYIHYIPPWSINAQRRQMVELFEKPDYDKFEPRYTPANLSNQLWAMYEVKRPYKGSQYYDDIGEFFNDKSREDFNEIEISLFLYVTNDTLIVGEKDGIYRSPDRIEASGRLGGGVSSIGMKGNVTYIIGDTYRPGWFQLNIEERKNFIGTIWSDKGEQQFIVGLKDQEKNRYVRYKDSYYWIEPMTLDNVLPFLP